MKNILHSTLLILFTLTFSCVPPEDPILTEVKLELQDSILQRIYTFQDENKTDSLFTYFQHKNPSYRYAAAIAFASTQDEAALARLAALLKNDEVEKVRVAAAYAMGQIGVPKGERLLIEGFKKVDSLGIFKYSNSAILEAVGKCGADDALVFLSTAKNYQPKDTALLEGQSWGLYRYMLRDKINAKGTQKMTTYVLDNIYPSSVRFIAANYLGRAKILEIDSIQAEALAVLLGNEKDPNIRMEIASALGKTINPLALGALKEQYVKETDYRVKCNIIRSLGKFGYPEVQEVVFQALTDSNKHVARQAAQFFLENGEAKDATVYWRQVRDNEAIDKMAAITLLTAANKYTKPLNQDYKWAINNKLKMIWEDSTANDYIRVAALKGLAVYYWNYEYIHDQAFDHENPLFRTGSMEALGSIARDPKIQRSSRARIKRKLKSYISKAINEGDTGVKAVAAQVLSDKSLGFTDMFENSSFLHVAKRKLELPREIETAGFLQEAINTFEGKKEKQASPDFNHPIDWAVLKGIEANTTAEIKTSRGNITLELMPLLAPGTVANFISLAKEGFYNDKKFHRVVPNFVAQGGCTRGDGYGSVNHTIRTEVPLVKYEQAGYVGMASAGKNTEGAQWFITHRATPHLDGKYTIFAKVIKGMDIVHELDMGDTINAITIE